MKRIKIFITAMFLLVLTTAQFSQSLENEVTSETEKVTNVTEQLSDDLAEQYNLRINRANELLKEIRVRIYLLQKDEKKLEELIEIYRSTIAEITNSSNKSRDK